MTTLFRKLLCDESGLILSAEIVIILTIAVLGMVVGLVNLQHALLGEFADLSMAFQSLNQSYSTPSYRGCWKFWGRTSWVAGSTFIDIFDGCVSNGAAGYATGDIVGGGYHLGSDSSQVVVGPHTTTDAVIPSPAACETPSSTPATTPIPQGAPAGQPCVNCQ